MAISTVGTDIDPFVPTSGPAPEDTRASQPEIEVSQPAPLPEGAGVKIDTSA
jgi:hypothetical protein